MKKSLLLSLLIASLLIANAASAGTVVTITKLVNTEGNIGLYIRNEFYPKMFTDSALRNASTLTFHLDGVRAPVDGSKSAESISPGDERLVVLRSPWPTSTFQNLSIVYTDGSGTSNYPVESILVFAKPALTVKEVITEPPHIFTNASVTIRLKMLAAGDKDVSSINVNVLNQPKYFQITDMSNPAFLKVGEEKEFIFKFKQSGEKMPETIIYSTSYFPVELSYSYYGYPVKTVINQTFVVLNRLTTQGLIPKLDFKLDVPPEIERGNSTNLMVYAWNSISGSNKICDVNLTLTADDASIEISEGTTFLPGPYEGRADIPEDPVTTFLIKTSPSTTSKQHTLTAGASYIDCDWKIPDKKSKSINFEVKSSDQQVT
ncbi:TPA: hypothetical protein H1005_00485, partial [archaeon]|nr:hypothetical protein [Candidatus Naiadarchaeales archaeon SRR2090153.bin1042]